MQKHTSENNFKSSSKYLKFISHALLVEYDWLAACHSSEKIRKLFIFKSQNKTFLIYIPLNIF